jgi:hypothetical protein
MIPPPNPASGPAASVAALERLRQFAISSNVTSGGGLRKAFGGGSVFAIPEVKRQRPSFGRRVTPFFLSNASDGTTLKVRIKYGTVNGVVPTGMTDISGLTTDPLPDPDKIVTITGSTWFWLKCVGTFGASEDTYAVTIETTTTANLPTGTTITGSGFVSFRKIGSATVSGTSISYLDQVITSNQSVESYGNTNLWFAQ